MQRLNESTVIANDYDTDESTDFDELSENLILRKEYIEQQRIFKRTPDQVHPDPDQPRKSFSEEALKQLAESMDETGQSTPIKVYVAGDSNHMEILYGESRYRAKRDYCEDKTLDCVLVDEPTEEEKYNIRVDENLRRSQFTVGELLDITVRYHGVFSAKGVPDVNQQVADRIKIHPSEVSRRLTVHRARKHNDELIGYAMAKLIETGAIDNINTLYYLGSALLADAAERRKNPARDLVLKALDPEAGPVTKKQAEEAGKKASGKSRMPHKWKPEYLRLPENKTSTGDDPNSSSAQPNQNDSSSENVESLPAQQSQNDPSLDSRSDKTTLNQSVMPSEGLKPKPPGRVLKTLSVTIGDDPNYLKITANSGFVTKEKAIEFANALIAAASEM
jgi:ParB/RepB/Spo0J family partition protein